MTKKQRDEWKTGEQEVETDRFSRILDNLDVAVKGVLDYFLVNVPNHKIRLVSDDFILKIRCREPEEEDEQK
jgi:hypothetical protein